MIACLQIGVKAAALVYKRTLQGAEAHVAYVDVLRNEILANVPVELSPSIAVFAEINRALVSYTRYEGSTRSTDWVDVYDLSSWKLHTRIRAESRAHFNVSPTWSPFVLSPDRQTVY